MLPLLCACQSESYQETAQPQRVIKVGAYLPNSNDTRTQVKYGSGVDETGETFMWNLGDEIFLYNLDATELINYVNLGITKIDGNKAEFESEPAELDIKPGDRILITYFVSSRYYKKDEQGNTTPEPDPRNIISLYVGTEQNKPQIIVKNPDDESLSYMKGNLMMYDVVTVDENGQIPDLHFKHLSALMRVTLRNETGVDLFPTKLEFKYPGTESFFNTTLYFSVNDDMSLKVYEDYEFFKGSAVYTDNIGTTINGKDGTNDVGESILNGESYELYISTVPRMGNDKKGDNFEIHLIVSHDTDYPYVITFDNFDTAIEAGKRYWFDLTAIITPEGERKLMLTSEWKKQQNEQGTTEPEAGNE